MPPKVRKEDNMEERRNNNVVVTVLIMLVLGLAGFIVYDKVINKTNEPNTGENNKVDNNEDVDNGNQGSDNVFTIDNNLLESSIKQALIKNIGKDEQQGIVVYDNSIWAEGHKTLGYELKEEKVYAYVNAEIGTYNKEKGVYKSNSSIAGPFVLIFTKDYDFVEYLQPANGVGYEESLKNIFPSNLIEEAINVDYRVDFYQEQIKSYLD